MEFSETSAREPRGLGWLLSYQASRNPGHPAFTMGDVTLTRSQLDSAANRMARALEDKGVGQDDFVVISLPNGPEHHIFTFAVWKLGATPVPISTRLPQTERMAILELVNPVLVIGQNPGQAGHFSTVETGFQPDHAISDAPLPEKVAKHWKAVTSGGSTGRPKLIVDGAPSAFLAHEPHQILKIEENDIVLHPAPMYHNAPFCQTNWAIVWGGHVITVSKFDAETWLRLVEKHQAKWAYLVPTMMNRIWALPENIRNKYDLSSLRVVMHMAAPCPPWLKKAWIDWLGPERIWEVYAGTEGIGGTLISGEEWLQHPGSVGKPQTDLRIMDENDQECPTGEVGEIYFRRIPGTERPYSYIGAESRAKEEWESLGDLGSLDADGYLYLADRRTDMIVSGGANIYPAEIEAALEEHPAITCAAVVGLPDAEFGRLPHALIELSPDTERPTAKELETFLSDRLARYKLPHTYEFTSGQLRDEAGKMRRTALRDICEQKISEGVTFDSLRTRSTPNT